jgi:hypothetical protein
MTYKLFVRENRSKRTENTNGKKYGTKTSLTKNELQEKILQLTHFQLSG